MRALVLTLLSWVVGASVAQAARSIEVSLGPQFNQRSGYLYGERSPVGLAFSVHFFGPAAAENVNRSFFDFQFASTRSKISTKEFPFASGSSGGESVFAVIPNVSFLERGPSHLFVGIGPALVTVAQDDPEPSNQTYGTFLWQVGARYEFLERWATIVKANYYNYEERVNGVKTFFANAGLRWEIGYGW